MKILITGGAGYIGSHTIVDLSESEDFDLVSVDAFFNSDKSTFERIKKIVSIDINNTCIDLACKKDADCFFEQNTDIKGIVHFAAHKAVGESQENPLEYYRNNIDSLINLLDCCEKYKINNFIFSSSCTVYGEPDSLPVNESFPIKQAQSVYGNTKQIGENIIEDFAKANPNFNAIILRYFNPIGAHSSGEIGELPKGVPNNLVPFITQSAIGLRGPLQVFGNDYDTRDGSCIRDYIHVSDIAHAHTLGINRLLNNENETPVEIFNLGTGNGVSVFEAITAFEKATNEKLDYQVSPRRAGDVIAVYSDSKKAEQLLKWTPTRSLEDAMASAWKWEKNLQLISK